jgi:LysM repeat protein
VLSASACVWLKPDAIAPTRQFDESARPVHRVEEGETLCSVGGRYGLSASALRASNGIETRLDEPLRAGISLRLEGVPATYTVRRGDTLFAIARWSGTEVDALARHNRMSDPAVLLEGQEVSIPAGATSACAPAATRPPEASGISRRSPTPSTHASARRATGEEAAAPSEIGEAEAHLARAEERYAEADYEACFRAAALAREQLAPHAESPQARRLAARATAMAGLAHAGRQHPEEAVAAFRTAFSLDPDFELEAQYASPKILPLLEEAREPEAER